jgi:hypothetical protein
MVSDWKPYGIGLSKKRREEDKKHIVVPAILS